MNKKEHSLLKNCTRSYGAVCRDCAFLIAFPGGQITHRSQGTPDDLSVDHMEMMLLDKVRKLYGIPLMEDLKSKKFHHMDPQFCTGRFPMDECWRV